MSSQGWRGPPADRDGVAVVEELILTGIHNKEGGMIWTGLICLQLGTGGGLLIVVIH